MKDNFKENIEWNIEQIAVQFGRAEKVNGRARSGYYKAAIILTASVVEALAFKILEQNKNLEMPFEEFKHKTPYLLPEKFCTLDGNSLCICEMHKTRFKLSKQTDFIKVNEVCLCLGIFSKGFFKKIERVRKLRNKIHIQGLDNLDRSYTKKELESVSSVMNELLSKIN